MRMAGVEVIDRYPIEPRSKVVFNLLHQAPGQRFEVFIMIAVFGRDDEPELMLIALPACQKRLSIGGIIVARMKLRWLSVTRGAVVLDIAQMRMCIRHSLTGKPDNPRLDDSAQSPVARKPVARCHDPRDTRPAPETRTGKA